MNNPTVGQIVREYLEKNGYDGLVSADGECGCELSDISPCGDWYEDCTAGYKVPCDPEFCPADGDCKFHIACSKGNELK